jgi:hypothetical protein
MAPDSNEFGTGLVGVDDDMDAGGWVRVKMIELLGIFELKDIIVHNKREDGKTYDQNQSPQPYCPSTQEI